MNILSPSQQQILLSILHTYQQKSDFGAVVKHVLLAPEQACIQGRLFWARLLYACFPSPQLSDILLYDHNSRMFAVSNSVLTELLCDFLWIKARY